MHLKDQQILLSMHVGHNCSIHDRAAHWVQHPDAWTCNGFSFICAELADCDGRVASARRDEMLVAGFRQEANRITLLISLLVASCRRGGPGPDHTASAVPVTAGSRLSVCRWGFHAAIHGLHTSPQGTVPFHRDAAPHSTASVDLFHQRIAVFCCGLALCMNSSQYLSP